MVFKIMETGEYGKPRMYSGEDKIAKKARKNGTISILLIRYFHFNASIDQLTIINKKTIKKTAVKEGCKKDSLKESNVE